MTLRSAKNMSAEPQKTKTGCFKWGVLIVLFIVILCTTLQWWHTRPPQIAKRYLGISKSTKLEVIQAKMDYTIPLDPAAHIYLEAEKDVIHSIIHNNGFVLQNAYMLEDRLRYLNFAGASTVEGANLVLYEKSAGNPVEYLVTTPEYTQIWYVALHY